MSEHKSNMPIRYKVAIILLSISLAAIIVVAIISITNYYNVEVKNDELTVTIEELNSHVSEKTDMLTASDTTIANLNSELEKVKSDYTALETTVNELQTQALEDAEKLSAAATTTADLQAKLDVAKAENATLTVTIEELQAQVSEASEKHVTSDNTITDLQAELETIKTENSSLKATIDELQAQALVDADQISASATTISDLQSELAMMKADNATLTTGIQDLQLQAVKDSQTLSAYGTAIANLQIELDAAKTESETSLQTLQGEYDAYKETSEAALAEWQQKYDADMLAASNALLISQEEAKQIQDELNAQIDDLTETLTLLKQTATDNEDTTEDLTVDEVAVSNATELLQAIKSNRIIHLQPGDYDLSSDGVLAIVEPRTSEKSPYVYYNDYSSGNMETMGVVVVNVENLTIIADEQQEIYTKYTADTVLNFEACSNITVSGVQFGHKPDVAKACVAGVLGMLNCSDMTFSKCDLYGCGVQGVYIIDSSSILFSNSIIRDCTDMAAYLSGVTDVKFIGTEIYGIGTDNEYVHTLVQISGNSEKILFQKCNIHDNGNINGNITTSMFLVVTGVSPTITDCTMTNNYYDYFIY